ncbi:MAG TPA: hypothetical protein GX723_00280 [Thermoanaerobacterales bacterium]|mgnify:CR=1 FL=1|nr:hypothetical protein [Thermoanaerobacterales bacterium]
MFRSFPGVGIFNHPYTTDDLKKDIDDGWFHASTGSAGDVYRHPKKNGWFLVTAGPYNFTSADGNPRILVNKK